MITRLRQTKIYSTLANKEDSEKILPTVEKIVEYVSPLLQKIPENMPEFTLHDPAHSNKIIEIMDKIIPEVVIQNFNSIELSLLILSAYLHDIGMTCDRIEKEHIIENDQEFDILFKSNIDKYQKYEQYKSEQNHRAATFIQDQIFTEFLRRNHVKRSAKYILENLTEGKYELTYNDIPFYKLLIKICNAHGEPVKNLYDNNMFPKETLIGNHIINVQYLSLILRLADILDLDAERTPKVIYEFVNPENPISILEWKKHRAVIGSSINEKKILFEAECSSPEVERALKEFIDWIELERKETIELLQTYSSEETKKYFLTLEEPVTKERIYSDESYIYNDLKFNLDYQRIMSLLMGQKLYKDPTTALRELLQNSIDAIKVRQKVYENKSEQISPIITLNLFENTLSIEDNGIGMNKEIFENYFLQIGKSYYSSQNFYSQFNTLDVTSEFGIGILSTFMIANSITIDSRREPDDPLYPYEPIHFEIPAAQSFLVQKKGEKREIGTKIILNLKENNPLKNTLQLIEIIESLIPEFPFPILVKQNQDVVNYNKKNDFEIDVINHNIDFEDFLIKNQIDEYNWRKNYTHSLFSIDFENESDPQLQDIKGKLLIVNSNPINYYSTFNGSLSQRSFAVGYPETYKNKFYVQITDSIHSLFPKWLSYYSTLNLTRNACLSITPDRTDFTIDEKYKTLKTKIENKIINEFDGYLNSIQNTLGFDKTSKFINFLFVSGFFGIDLHEVRRGINISTNAKAFLLKWITVPVLSDQGEIIHIQLNKITDNENIGIIVNPVSEKNIPKLISFKSINNLQLVLLRNSHFLSHRDEELFLGLLGSTRDISSSIKTFLKPLAKNPIYLYRYKFQQVEKDLDHYQQTNISNSENIDDPGSVIFYIKDYTLSIYFNICSPFVNFLFKDLETKGYEKEVLKKQISNDLEQCIADSLNILKKSENIEDVKTAHSDYAHIALNEILNKDTKLLDNLNNIFSSLLKNAKDLKIVNENQEYTDLTHNELPWYWSKNI
jgi:hypothetical protein